MRLDLRGSTPRVLMLGTGTAATSIVEGLLDTGVGRVGAVVDPEVSGRPWAAELAGRGLAFPHLDDVAPEWSFDAAAVAVPTPLHFDVLGDLLRWPRCPPLVLSEKPLTSEAAQASELRALAAARGVELRTLFHFAFSPEVVWLGETIGELSAPLGPLREVASYFADNYLLGDVTEAAGRLGGPWLDSGVNSLSVVLQLVDVAGVTGHEGEEPRLASVRFAGTGGEAVSVTVTWDDEARPKRTRLVYDDSTILVDHVGQTVAVDGEVRFRRHAGGRGARYSPMVRKHLTGPWTERDTAFEAAVLGSLYAGVTALAGA